MSYPCASLPIGRGSVAFSLALCVACGGATASSSSDAGPTKGPTDQDSAAPDSPGSSDAGGSDTGPGDGPAPQCHGYCPQPNGAICMSDCDCENKCLLGRDPPARCADPLVPAIPCGDAAACPSGQSCGLVGACEGAACSSNDDCPSKQQCTGKSCVAFGCI